MARATGFIDFEREEPGHRPVAERVGDYREIDLPLPDDALLRQAWRCMDCGTPYCHAVGCPVRNLIPEFNELVGRGRWREAAERLHSTNNFPEVTGRVCPAPCEPACTLDLDGAPVLIKHIELRIAERAWDEGWVKPLRAARRTGRRVAVVGSGPAGLAAAQQLARLGHDVVVFEKSDRVGGLLRYGIPDFKLDKRVLDRRLAQLAAEGVELQTGVHVGADLSVRYLRRVFDAVLLAIGAGAARDLDVPGRDASNVVMALEFLSRQNRLVAGDVLVHDERLTARGKVVAVIGGGDTGSDCVGTARRQGARAIHQLELLPRPADARPPHTPWPAWPQILRTSSSHEEGCERRWGVLTKRLSGEAGRATRLHAVEVEWSRTATGLQMREVPGSELELDVDLVILAMGFVHADHSGLVEALGVELDDRGNLAAPRGTTSLEGVFAAGDAVTGASLVVTAIQQGRDAAGRIDRWLESA